MNSIVLEIIGYIGTALVIISMLMTSVVKLRLINSIGSVITIFYGILIKAFPTVLLNAVLLLINFIYLLRMHTQEKSVFTITDGKIDEDLLKFFFKTNYDDIKFFYPEFEKSLDTSNLVKIVFCKNEIVGVTAGLKTDTQVEIFLDYTTKQYRDATVGRMIYSLLKEEKFKTVIYTQSSERSVDYFKGLGFIQEGSTFTLDLEKKF